jgi:hypothetical protein
VLIRLAEAETFDIIGEIAIEGLGSLGDPSAVPVLQRIAGDGARDKSQRDLAVKALARLGASATAGAGATTGAGATGGATGAGAAGGATGAEPTGGQAEGGQAEGGGKAGAGGGTGSSLLGDRADPALPALPVLPENLLAASERLTFAIGTASLAYDSVRGRSSFDADVAGQYDKRIEQERVAWGWSASAHVLAGLINPEGRAQTRGAQVVLGGGADLRYYVAPRVYVGGRAAIGSQIDYVADLDGNDPQADLRDARLAFDVQAALLAGYGRLLDVGGAIRVRRLSRALDGARALGKPIDPALARRLQLTWWALRGERSTFRALIATVKILREAGVLLGEPDAGLSYEILNVLRDSQLFLRPSGLDLQLGVGESYLVRPGDIGDGSSTAAEEGRVEQLLFAAGYGLQAADDTVEISGAGYGRLRVLAPDDPRQPAPWAFGATARFRKLTYGAHGDPFGAFDLAADLRISNDDRNAMGDNQTGVRLGGQLGFTYWLNQASGIRLAATAAIDSGELFLGAQLQATYGFLDATFAGL